MNNILADSFDPLLLDGVADEIIKSIVSTSSRPESDWTADDWKMLSREIMELLLYQRMKSAAKTQAYHSQIGNYLIDEYMEYKRKNKDRIKNRRDQIDMRAFQDMVKANIGKYNTKADAIYALKTFSQFTDYSDNQLRKWLTPEVWNKSTKIGRPAKTKK